MKNKNLDQKKEWIKFEDLANDSMLNEIAKGFGINKEELLKKLRDGEISGCQGCMLRVKWLCIFDVIPDSSPIPLTDMFNELSDYWFSQVKRKKFERKMSGDWEGIMKMVNSYLSLVSKKCEVCANFLDDSLYLVVDKIGDGIFQKPQSNFMQCYEERRMI